MWNGTYSVFKMRNWLNWMKEKCRTWIRIRNIDSEEVLELYRIDIYRFTQEDIEWSMCTTKIDCWITFTIYYVLDNKVKSSTTNSESTNCLRDYETYALGCVIGTWKVCVLTTEVRISENWMMKDIHLCQVGLKVE